MDESRHIVYHTAHRQFIWTQSPQPEETGSGFVRRGMRHQDEVTCSRAHSQQWATLDPNPQGGPDGCIPQTSISVGKRPLGVVWSASNSLCQIERTLSSEDRGAQDGIGWDSGVGVGGFRGEGKLRKKNGMGWRE